MTRQEFRHLGRPTQNLNSMTGRSNFRFNCPAKGGISAHGNGEPDVCSLAETSNERWRFFFSGVNQVQNPFWTYIIAGEPMVDHLSKTMRNRKTKNMDPVFGYAPCSQNGGGVVVGDNKVITRATVPDRIYGNRIGHYRDLRKSPRFADRQNLVNDVAVQWISRNNGVVLKLAKSLRHATLAPSQ